MPNNEAELDAVFKAIADRTRRAIIERLSRGPAAVSVLAEPFGIALPSVMQHLDLLTAAGIVESQKIGRIRTFQLVPGALNAVASWANQQRTYPERQADRLAAHLKETES